jgi:RNA polymerase sigma factor (TIGR02999 family)
MAIAAREMRHALIDHARHAKSEKRGGNAPRISLENLVSDQPGVSPVDVDILDLHRLLGELEQMDPEVSRVLELKFFAGLTDEEIASEAGISFAKVRRHWSFARAWMLARLQNSG